MFAGGCVDAVDTHDSLVALLAHHRLAGCLRTTWVTSVQFATGDFYLADTCVGRRVLAALSDLVRMVGERRLELPASCSQSRLEPFPFVLPCVA